MSTPTDKIHEWIVTKALESNLKASGSAWLFDLEARTLNGLHSVEHTCGFGYRDSKGEAQRILRFPERGMISEEDWPRFKDCTPDFRFWTPDFDPQLIIEFKGKNPPSRRDSKQACRYLEYFKARPANGALLYAVPQPGDWREWLEQQAAALSMGDFPVGTIGWDVILPHIKNELLEVIETEQRKLGQMLTSVTNLTAA
jgi:hypothetical protein